MEFDEVKNLVQDQVAEMTKDLRDQVDRHDRILRKMETSWFMSVVKGLNLTDLVRCMVEGDVFDAYSITQWSVPLHSVYQENFGDFEINTRFLEWCAKHEITLCVNSEELFTNPQNGFASSDVSIEYKHEDRSFTLDIATDKLYTHRVLETDFDRHMWKIMG